MEYWGGGGGYGVLRWGRVGMEYWGGGGEYGVLG